MIKKLQTFFLQYFVLCEINNRKKMLTSICSLNASILSSFSDNTNFVYKSVNMQSQNIYLTLHDSQMQSKQM